MRSIICFILLLFPWCIRRLLLTWIFGYKIHPTARIGLSLILPRRLEMGRGCIIGHFTICRSSVDAVIMGSDSTIGSLCTITGISTLDKKRFSHIQDRKCEMVLGENVSIPSRKFFDCNGGIYIGAFTTIAGQWTQFLTHSIDVYKSRQDAKPIRIGKYCFIGTGCTLLPGSGLPDCAVLAAGSVLTRMQTDSYCVYAGVPAEIRKRFNQSDFLWAKRTNRFVY